MQDPYPESSNHFYYLLDLFPSVKHETTKCAVSQSVQKRQSYVCKKTHLDQLRPNCRTGSNVQTGNSCINLAAQKFAKRMCTHAQQKKWLYNIQGTGWGLSGKWKTLENEKKRVQSEISNRSWKDSLGFPEGIFLRRAWGSAYGCKVLRLKTELLNLKQRHLTTNELIRSIDAIWKGVTLLLQEDALATGTSELIGQTKCCTERKD